MINMDQVKTTDEMISELSDDAKIVLIKMGIDWKAMTGNSCSWVSNELLESLFKIEHSWTINSLQKFSGCGRAGIEWGFMPKFKEYNLIVRDDVITGRYTYWKLSDIGREVLNIMLTSCTECNNTGICGMCDGEGTPPNAEECNHRLWTDCEECGADGKDSDGDECWHCIGPGQTCNECNGTGYRKCRSCCGYSRDSNERGKCVHCNIGTPLATTYRSLRAGP